jgi:hypothetical protein
MSRQELKVAINEILEETPDVVLNEVLDYLNTVKDKTEQTIISSQNINNILREDKELLERLAK